MEDALKAGLGVYQRADVQLGIFVMKFLDRVILSLRVRSCSHAMDAFIDIVYRWRWRILFGLIMIRVCVFFQLFLIDFRQLFRLTQAVFESGVLEDIHLFPPYWAHLIVKHCNRLSFGEARTTLYQSICPR